MKKTMIVAVALLSTSAFANSECLSVKSVNVQPKNATFIFGTSNGGKKIGFVNSDSNPAFTTMAIASMSNNLSVCIETENSGEITQMIVRH